MADRASTSATMPSDHTNTTTSRIGTIEQPHSRLHALPIELRAMIYEYAVISPDYIPAITAPIAPRRTPEIPSRGKRFPSRGFLRTPAPLPKEPQRTHLTTLPQPPLSQTDRATRAEVLPIFYGRNTLLFRITPLVRSPLQSWLDVTGSGGRAFFGEEDFAGGAARWIERVAIERQVEKACVRMLHIEDRRAPGVDVPMHTYRIVVGLMTKEEKEKRKGDGQQQQQQRQQHQPQSSTPTPRPLLIVQHEADLSGTCDCTLRAAAWLPPPRWSSSQRAAEVLSFACDVEDLVFRDLAGDCQLGWICDDGDDFHRRRLQRTCSWCRKRVSRGLFGDGDGVGDRLMPWYETVAKTEAEAEAEGDGER
ncbi:hypothetical protein Q7P36_002533 [Cladosporium allicinum]